MSLFESSMPQTKRQIMASIPFCIAGLVEERAEVDFCMDGATHLLAACNNSTIRLKARSTVADSLLKAFCGTGRLAVICGYWVKGAECDHISVYSVSELVTKEAEEFAVFARVDEKGQCIVEEADAILPAIYSRVYGPASREECETWQAMNCR